MTTITDFDERLTEGGVRFLPWIGMEYDLGFRGKRFMVLGESHYNQWDGKEHDLNLAFTRFCIEQVVGRKEKGAPFWLTLEQALLNEEREAGWPPSGGAPLWRQIAFYNFVQRPVDGGYRVKPSIGQFRDSWAPFRTVLEALRPERVLVCGRRLWSSMEPTPHERNEGNAHFAHGYVQAYLLEDGSPVWCLCMVHPSSGRLSWSRWHPIICDFIEDPFKAAKAL